MSCNMKYDGHGHCLVITIGGRLSYIQAIMKFHCNFSVAQEEDGQSIKYMWDFFCVSDFYQLFLGLSTCAVYR